MKKLVCILLLLSVNSFAADWHVSQAGSDTTGNGSVSTPWRSIGKAITNTGILAPGDTVWVAPGWYPEVRLTPTVKGTSGSKITLRGDYSNSKSMASTAGFVVIDSTLQTTKVVQTQETIRMGASLEWDYWIINGFYMTGAYYGLWLQSGHWGGDNLHSFEMTDCTLWGYMGGAYLEFAMDNDAVTKGANQYKFTRVSFVGWRSYGLSINCGDTDERATMQFYFDSCIFWGIDWSADGITMPSGSGGRPGITLVDPIIRGTFGIKNTDYDAVTAPAYLLIRPMFTHIATGWLYADGNGSFTFQDNGALAYDDRSWYDSREFRLSRNPYHSPLPFLGEWSDMINMDLGSTTDPQPTVDFRGVTRPTGSRREFGALEHGPTRLLSPPTTLIPEAGGGGGTTIIKKSFGFGN